MIYRGRQHDIIFEFSLASSSSKGTVVMCDGLPSVPKQKELMLLLNGYGYNVFFPRYRGTWESGGEFLAQSPTLDILAVIDLLKSGSVVELYHNKNFQISGPIFLLGSSWGGAVVLSLADCVDIHKIIALSPIINFDNHQQNQNTQDLNFLERFIRRGFNQAYRFQDQDWKRMAEGKLFTVNDRPSRPVTIVYDQSDTTVDGGEIEGYSSRNSEITTMIKVDGAGHLSFSKLSPDLLGRIFQ